MVSVPHAGEMAAEIANLGAALALEGINATVLILAKNTAKKI